MSGLADITTLNDTNLINILRTYDFLPQDYVDNLTYLIANYIPLENPLINNVLDNIRDDLIENTEILKNQVNSLIRALERDINNNRRENRDIMNEMNRILIDMLAVHKELFEELSIAEIRESIKDEYGIEIPDHEFIYYFPAVDKQMLAVYFFNLLVENAPSIADGGGGDDGRGDVYLNYRTLREERFNLARDKFDLIQEMNNLRNQIGVLQSISNILSRFIPEIN